MDTQSFEIERWLAQAEKLVPELYKRFVRAEQSSSESGQEPALLDFSRKSLTIAKH